MKNFNKIIFFVIFVIFISCSDSVLINGTYNNKQHPFEFTFSEDSTFRYVSRHGCYTESSGTWFKSGDFIYLNSTEQIDSISVKFHKTTGNKKNTLVNVKVNVPENPERDYICYPIINGNKDYIFAMERGSYIIESESPIHSLYFIITKSPFVLRGTGPYGCFNDIKTETIFPSLAIGDDIYVTINILDELFGYHVFKNDKLEIKKGKINFKYKNKDYRLTLKK